MGAMSVVLTSATTSDDVLVQRCAGARRDVSAGLPGSMRLIGLAVVFAVSLTLAPLAAQGQQAGKVWRIGVLTSAVCPDEAGPPGRMLSEGLRERGHTVGKTVVFECRRSDEGLEVRFRQLAADLVRLKVDLIIGISSAAIRALWRATTTIPIVAIDVETDPVGSGLAVSLARPDGNITGIFLDAPEMSGKRLQLLKEAVPRLSRVAVLWDASTDPTMLSATETAARCLRGLSESTSSSAPPRASDSARRAIATRPPSVAGHGRRGVS